MATFQLRRAELQDAPAIASMMVSAEDVRQVAPQEKFPVSADTVKQWHRDRVSGYVLVGENRIIAYGEINPDPQRNRRFWIGHVIVDPEIRGHGIGQYVVSSLTALAVRTMRASDVWISAFADNPTGLTCYLRCGFEESQRREMMGRVLVDLVYRPRTSMRLLSRPYAAVFGACAAGTTVALLPSDTHFWILEVVGGDPAIFVALASLLVMLLAVLWQPLLPRDSDNSSGLVLRPVLYGVAVGVSAASLVVLAVHMATTWVGAGLPQELFRALEGGAVAGAGWGVVLLVFAAGRHRRRSARSKDSSG